MSSPALRRRTTYRDFIWRWVAGFDGGIPTHIKQGIGEREAQIAGWMKPGDELWEWEKDARDRLAGPSGLAIARNGQIVVRWVEWQY